MSSRGVLLEFLRFLMIGGFFAPFAVFFQHQLFGSIRLVPGRHIILPFADRADQSDHHSLWTCHIFWLYYGLKYFSMLTEKFFREPTMGIGPMTPSLPKTCSTNWATSAKFSKTCSSTPVKQASSDFVLRSNWAIWATKLILAERGKNRNQN